MYKYTMMDDETTEEVTDEVMDEFFSDHDYRDYNEIVNGRYMAALMRRSNITGGSLTAEEEFDSTSATTLSRESRKAFQEPQEQIKWVARDNLGAFEEDFGDATDQRKELKGADAFANNGEIESAAEDKKEPSESADDGDFGGGANDAAKEDDFGDADAASARFDDSADFASAQSS